MQKNNFDNFKLIKLLVLIAISFNVYANTIYIVNTTGFADNLINVIWLEGYWNNTNLADYKTIENTKKFEVGVPENATDFIISSKVNDAFIKSEKIKIHDNCKYVLILNEKSKHCKIHVIGKKISPKNSMEFQSHQNNFNNQK